MTHDLNTESTANSIVLLYYYVAYDSVWFKSGKNYIIIAKYVYT